MDTPQPFRYRVDDAAIADLHRRIDHARWPDQLGDEDWGLPIEALRGLVHHWRHEFDWRAQERALFDFAHFVLPIDGLDLHFIHARSPHENAQPICLTHGWPGSVMEFLELIPRLTHPEQHGGNPEDAFHVVVPSLQGYGFSPAATSPGMSPSVIAERQTRLMAALGYDRYIAQGGDWGSRISQGMASVDPTHCIGLHLNLMQPVRPRDVADPMALVQPHEHIYLRNSERFSKTGSGYYAEQSTRPQTLAYALADSAVGLCAWIGEKFAAWSELGLAPEGIGMDRILGNISLYWFTGTIGSSVRLYKEHALAEARGERLRRVSVPTGIAAYPFDVIASPRAWAERALPVVHWYDAPCGGHFAAMEQPELFAADLRRFRQALA